MTDHESNRTAEFEGVAGPNLSYSWVAEVSREAAPQGLDGGRIQNLSVVKMRGPQRGEAPGFDEAEAYEAWLAQQPTSTQVARYENGQLTCDQTDAHAEAIVKEVKETFTDLHKDLWQDRFPAPEPEPAIRISRSGDSQTRHNDGGRER